MDVAISAGQTISDLLNQMKAKALAGADSSLDTNSRTALANDYVALRSRSARLASASFNGTNLLACRCDQPLLARQNSTGAQKRPSAPR